MLSKSISSRKSIVTIWFNFHQQYRSIRSTFDFFLSSFVSVSVSFRLNYFRQYSFQSLSKSISSFRLITFVSLNSFQQFQIFSYKESTFFAFVDRLDFVCLRSIDRISTAFFFAVDTSSNQSQHLFSTITSVDNNCFCQAWFACTCFSRIGSHCKFNFTLLCCRFFSLSICRSHFHL